MKGKVIRSTGKWYNVELETKQVVNARILGKIRLQDLDITNPVAVGDKVALEKTENNDWNITNILPRDNYIIRQSPRKKHQNHILASNIDQALLLVTVANPRTSTGFIDRFLVTAEAYHIPTIIVFNKQDILSDKEQNKQKNYEFIYKNAGYLMYKVSSLTQQGINAVRNQLKDKTTLLCGHSGVGKSTFANAISPSLNLKTGELSDKYLKGKHTTTFAELFKLPFGGSLIDIPGIKEFGVVNFENGEVGGYFPEIRALMPNCKFSNCLHLNEPNCKVLEALENNSFSSERYNNYVNILNDIEAAKAFY